MIPPAAVALGLAALAIASRSSRSSRSSGPSSTSTGYALARLPYLRARWRDPAIRRAVERYAAMLLPGLPPVAALAFSVSSEGLTERVNGAPLGLFGVETSRRDAWIGDTLTREALGRTPDVDAWATDVDAQVYLGLRRYRVALEELRTAARAAGLEPGLEPLRWRPWEYQSAVASYSAGQGTTLAVFRAAPVALRAPAAIRWTRLAEDLSPGLAGRRELGGRPVRGVAGIAWALVRPRERYEATRALASELHDAAALAWCDSPPWPFAEDRALWRLAHARRA